MRPVLPNLLFFGLIGFMADLFNFAGAQAEILAGTFVFKGTEFQLGILGACSSLFYAIPTLFTGLLSERVGRRPLVIAALIGMGSSYAWGACATSMQELYAVTTLRSLSTAMLWPPVMAWMARAVNPRQFARFLGSYNLSWATGTFFGFWGAGYLFEKISWPSPFWVSCGLAVLLLIFVSVFSPRGGSGVALPVDAKAEHDHHGQSPEQARFFVRQGLIMAGAGMLATSIGLYIFPKVAQGILSEVQISFLNSIRLVGQMAAFFMMGKFDAWHFRRWPVWGMTTIIILGLAILAAGQIYPHFILGFLLIGVGFGAGFSMCAYYALGLSQKKGKGSGMMETMIGVGGLSGSLIGGATASLVSARAGLLSGFLPLILCSVFATLNPPEKKPD